VEVVILNAILAAILMYLLVRRARRDDAKRPGRRPPEE
jgi:hypothetical protein